MEIRAFHFFCKHLKSILTRSISSAPGGALKCCPPGAVLRDFRARRHFENAIGHTFAGKSRPVEAISHIHRARFTKSIESARETGGANTAEMLCCDSPPKCRAFVIICCYMLHNHNTATTSLKGLVTAVKALIDETLSLSVAFDVFRTAADETGVPVDPRRWRNAARCSSP